MPRIGTVPQEFKEARDKLHAAGCFNVAEFRGFAAGRVRHGKTQKDRQSGAHANSKANKQKRIRCTSSHRVGCQDDRGPEFWCG